LEGQKNLGGAPVEGAHHLTSFDLWDSILSKSFTPLFYFPKIMTFLKDEDISRSLRTRELTFIDFWYVAWDFFAIMASGL
jgi:hypothetical protein